MVLWNVRRFTLGKLNGENAQRPDIDFVAVLTTAFYQLWSHPADCADFALTALLLLGEDNCVPKVSQFDLSIRLDEDVVRLDIPVDNVLPVQID